MEVILFLGSCVPSLIYQRKGFQSLRGYDSSKVGEIGEDETQAHVPCNESGRSRVSIDFRVGVEGYFDPEWSMKGTVDDHNRDANCREMIPTNLARFKFF